MDLKIDRSTARSRGFGFVIFKSLEGINSALSKNMHFIKGKLVTCAKALVPQGKIYVGNLPAGEGFSEEIIRDHFQLFGSVMDISRPSGKTFAFITFATEESAKRWIEEGQTTIDGVKIVIRKVRRQQFTSGLGMGEMIGGGRGFAEIDYRYGCGGGKLTARRSGKRSKPY